MGRSPCLNTLLKLTVLTSGQGDAYRCVRDMSRTCLVEVSASRSKSRMAQQDWRRVQPRVAASLRVPTARLAILGHGGLGKTTVLRQISNQAERSGHKVCFLRGEQLAGMDTKRFESGTSVARILCAPRQLHVFVDDLNSLAGDADRRRVVAALGRVAAEGARVVVSSRVPTWEALSSEPGTTTGWLAAPLDEWSERLVRKVAPGEHLTPTLLRLLRTPLFLENLSAHPSCPPPGRCAVRDQGRPPS